MYEKFLKIEKGKRIIERRYYIREVFSGEFCCNMYNVGITSSEGQNEIEDFSPEYSEAVKLCDALYEKTVSPKEIFSFAEEFILSV